MHAETKSAKVLNGLYKDIFYTTVEFSKKTGLTIDELQRLRDAWFDGTNRKFRRAWKSKFRRAWKSKRRKAKFR